MKNVICALFKVIYHVREVASLFIPEVDNVLCFVNVDCDSRCCWVNLDVAFDINSLFCYRCAIFVVFDHLLSMKNVICTLFKIVYNVLEVCSLCIPECDFVAFNCDCDCFACWSELIITCDIDSLFSYAFAECLMVYILCASESIACILFEVVYHVSKVCSRLVVEVDYVAFFSNCDCLFCFANLDVACDIDSAFCYRRTEFLTVFSLGWSEACCCVFKIVIYNVSEVILLCIEECDDHVVLIDCYCVRVCAHNVVTCDDNCVFCYFCAEFLACNLLVCTERFSCCSIKIFYCVLEVCSLVVVEIDYVFAVDNCDFCACWSYCCVAEYFNRTFAHLFTESLVVYCLGFVNLICCALFIVVYCVGKVTLLCVEECDNVIFNVDNDRLLICAIEVIACDCDSIFCYCFAVSLISHCLFVSKGSKCTLFEILYNVGKFALLCIVEVDNVVFNVDCDRLLIFTNEVIACDVDSSFCYVCAEFLTVYCICISKNLICALFEIIYNVREVIHL